MDATLSAELLRGEVTGSPPLQEALRVEVTDGPDRGKTMWIHDGQPTRLLVGRSEACDLHLTDPSVSARHLAFVVADGRVEVEDVGSRNGTYLSGVRVLRAPLSGNEVLKFGQTTLELHTASRLASKPPTIVLPNASSFGRVLGASREMRRLYVLLERLARADVPILIEGETGTGKEVLAEAIHEMGPRAKKPFQVFDCTTVPANLVESVLFGHERGAFTGASEARAGILELADGGTLLIDEIGDLDIMLQPKLLRVIEKQEFRRVGGSRTLRTNVRLLSATRRNLDDEIQQGRFRDDLFHRLAVTRVELPPLRTRKGDIRMLVHAFVANMNGNPSLFDETLLRKWESASWPGNIRELRNAVARRLALGELGDSFEFLSPADRSARTPTGMPEVVAQLTEQMIAQGRSLHEVREHVGDLIEANYVKRLLADHKGNVSRTAETMGMTRRHLHRILARHQG
jgi:two-component system, NtrC family, response regulator HydG